MAEFVRVKFSCTIDCVGRQRGGGEGWPVCRFGAVYRPGWQSSLTAAFKAQKRALRGCASVRLAATQPLLEPIHANLVRSDDVFSLAHPSSRRVMDAVTPTANAPPQKLITDVQVAAAQQAAHTESLQVMSKRLAELYSEMGLPVGAGGGMPGAK